MTFIFIIIFVLGLCVGSFVNAFQYRAQTDKKITGRSFCPNCKYQLAWYDLIPLASWVLLAGKCRYCKKQISVQYPLIEFLTGTLFVAAGLKSGYIQKFTDYFLESISLSNKELLVLSFSAICLFVIVGCLLLIALHDYKTKYVLSIVVYVAIAASVFLLLANYNDVLSFWPLFKYLYPYVIPAVTAGIIFYLIHALSKGKWMGAGDIEIVFLMGIFLGWPNTLIAFYVAFILGAIIGVILLVVQRAKLKSEVPFGPFLITGTFVAYLFGTQILLIYDRIFLGF